MSFVKKVWLDPIKLDASNINRIEQGLKNSYDNIEIIKEEVLSLQLSNAKLNTKVNTLFSTSPKILEDIASIQTILNSNSAILDTLKDTSHLLTKDPQLLTSEEIKQVQKNLGIDKFLHLTDIKLNGESIVSGSEVEIKLPIPDTKLDASSDNALSNRAIAQALQDLSKSIKYSDIIGTPTYKDIALNHNHNNLYALIDHLHSNYSLTNHDHDTKYSSISHDHNSIYSLYNHIHNNYAKALHTHSNYASIVHYHDNDYSKINHTHNTSDILNLHEYALATHTHDNRYSKINHIHQDYAPLAHSHIDINDYIKRIQNDILDIEDSIKNNDTFATKDYVQQNGGKIDSISVNGTTMAIENKNVNITIPTSLDQLTNTPGYIIAQEAKDYTDTAISNLINGSKETLDTLSELADAIENNADIIEVLDSAVANKAEKNHTHTESQITDLKNYALTTHKHTESDITNLKNYALSSHTHKESEIADLKDYALSGHTHLYTDISNLDAALANYSLTTHKHDNLYSALNHTHTESEITDLQNYALKSHTHSISDVSNLSTQLSSNLSTAKSYTDAEITEISATFNEALEDTNNAVTTNTNSISTLNTNLTALDSKVTSHNHDTLYSKLGHTHSYLPLSGGTLTDTVTMSGGDFLARYVGISDAGHETGTYDKIAILSNTTNGYIRYRTKAELKSDLGVPTDYAKKAEGVYLIDGTGNTTEGTWEGTNSRITSYYDGLTVIFKVGIAGISDGTTLNINNLGAKACYLRGTTKVTTHYAVGTMVIFTYNATTDAFYSSDYDANSSVTQTVRTTNGNFPLLLRGTSAGTTTTTTSTTFGTKMTANPSTGNISAASFTENGTLLSNKYAPKTHTHDYLPLSGGNLSGHVYLTGAQATSSTGNTSQLVFGTSDNNHLAITSNTGALVLNPSTTSTTGQMVLYTGTGTSKIPGNLTVGYTATAGTVTAGTFNVNASGIINLGGTSNSTGAKLKWGTVNSKNPYIGYATDQSDGTFVVSSLLGTTYASGLAIGGGSGNLLWKGNRVATANEIPTDYVKYTEDSTSTWAESNLTTILNKVYPIGAIYLSVNTTSPATLFGGTWTELSSGNALWVTSVSSGNAGQTIAAGLPNITGTWGSRWNQAIRGFHEATASGAFYIQTDTSMPGRITAEDGSANNSTHNGYPWFDASRSNAIYGNSTTVQPPAVRIYAWKRTA